MILAFFVLPSHLIVKMNESASSLEVKVNFAVGLANISVLPIVIIKLSKNGAFLLAMVLRQSEFVSSN
jgi:hypothetical protein